MKQSLMILFSLVLLIFTISTVDAYKLYCLEDGESLPPDCEDDSSCRYTCDLRSGDGFCQICTTDSGMPGVNPSKCNDLTCDYIGGDSGGTDQEPPEMILTNPVDGETYGNRRVYIILTSDPRARLEFMDNLNGGGWRTLSSSKVSNYNRAKSFKEGVNDITIRARKDNGQTDEERVVFYVDSRDPDVREVIPSKEKFLNGRFSVEYTELNLDRVEFQYRGESEGGWNVVEVPGCDSGSRMTCSLDVDLSPYEGGEVEYKFLVYDSANVDESKVYDGKVDTTDPVLTINTPFESGYDERKVLFDLSSSEEVEFFYIDNNDERNRHKRICRDGLECEKEVSFKDGAWDITIYTVDEAGNFDSESIVFFIDTKKPNIKKTNPRNNKWVNNGGLISVEYDETNLAGVSLFYGFNDVYTEVVLDGCSSGKRQVCETNVDFSAFNGRKVDAYFVVSDDYNSISGRSVTWKVDTDVPQFLGGFNPASSSVEDNVVSFNLMATEDDVEFSYKESDDDRYKNLCRRNPCEKSKKFRSGSYTLDLKVEDDAGNFVVEQFSFTI